MKRLLAVVRLPAVMLAAAAVIGVVSVPPVLADDGCDGVVLDGECIPNAPPGMIQYVGETEPEIAQQHSSSATTGHQGSVLDAYVAHHDGTPPELGECAAFHLDWDARRWICTD